MKTLRKGHLTRTVHLESTNRTVTLKHKFTVRRN